MPTPTSRRRSSIRDVASVAGVSNQTVSRVINSPSAVREETRERVLQAMELLKYRPNVAARALVTRRSNTIGILACNTKMYGPASSIAAIESAARARGRWVTIAMFDPDSDQSPNEALAHLLAQAVEAIVLITPTARVIRALATEGVEIPYLSLQSSDMTEGETLSVDQIEGARIATRHLIELGHTRIMHLAGPQDWLEAAARANGYRSELEAHGITAPSPIVGDWTADFGFEVAQSLVARNLVSQDPAAQGPATQDPAQDPANSQAFTAVFSANDQMAFGLMHGLREQGIDVPGDVSVIGFDDVPEAAHVSPPLTTVRQDFGDLGRRCVDHLLARIAGDQAIDAASITPQLVLRRSTATAPTVTTSSAFTP